MMRTLSQIIDACHKDGELSDRELKCAVLALESLVTLKGSAIRNTCLPAGRHYNDKDRRRIAEEDHRRTRSALGAVPEKWLGDRLPGNPEHLRRRRIAQGLLDKAAKGELPTQRAQKPGASS